MTRSVIAQTILMVGGLLGPLSSMPTLAQDDCAPSISSLAETVLAGRDGLPPLQARRFGTRAIYLLSHYGDRGADEIDALLSQAVEARIRAVENAETVDARCGAKMRPRREVHQDFIAQVPLEALIA